MRALVTGAAGFIGSHVVERLLGAGHDVTGIDSFSPYYDPDIKRRNIKGACSHEHFQLLKQDLSSCPLDPLLDGVDVVFHLAAQAGVRASWAAGFTDYVLANVSVTQRLLEASLHASLTRFVYASSSSVYGNATTYPTSEELLPAPESPYGVTKLAGEHLVRLYDSNFGLPTTSLRYFSVYGPRQRPDMGINKLIAATLSDGSFPLFGDGKQLRDFTFVGDVVEATVRAADKNVERGAVVNVAAGGSTSMLEVVEAVGALAGRPVSVDWQPEQPGDVRQTGGTNEFASEVLGWRPTTPLSTGIAQQFEWQRDLR